MLIHYSLGWKGALTVGPETVPHKAFHTLVLSAQEGETGVKITATEDDTQFVLVCARSESIWLHSNTA